MYITRVTDLAYNACVTISCSERKAAPIVRYSGILSPNSAARYLISILNKLCRKKSLSYLSIFLQLRPFWPLSLSANFAF